MKKICFVALIILFVCGIKAGDFNDKGLVSNKTFFPLQVDVGLIESKKLVDESTNTFLALGLFLVQQKSSVLSFATIVNALQDNYGLQVSPFLGVSTDNNYGISIGFENYAKKCYGAQIGIFNHHWMGKDIQKENERLQICGINFADTLFVGLINLTSKFQIGLFNLGRAKFQIGLLNFNPGSYIPFCPIINFDMNRKIYRPLEDDKEKNTENKK